MYSQNDYFDTPAGQNAPLAEEMIKKTKWYRRWWGRLILVVLVIFLSLIVALIFYTRAVIIKIQTGQLTADQLFGRTATTTPAQNFPNMVVAGAPSLGSKDAKVVIVEFGDFQCTYCQQEQAVIKQLLKDYGNKIFFVFRDFPLIADHPNSGNAALAADCANDQGKYWEMSDLLFANPNGINITNLKTWAVQLGLDTIQFGTCIDTAKYQKKIETDLLDGYNAGVKATPTFFINGYRLEGAVPLATFEQIIAAELSR